MYATRFKRAKADLPKAALHSRGESPHREPLDFTALGDFMYDRRHVDEDRLIGHHHICLRATFKYIYIKKSHS